jgi:ribosomal-protein-alanine N-acetyltransferase
VAILETTRLVGEPVTLEHRDLAIRLFGDPDVARWIWPDGRADSADAVGPRNVAQTMHILAEFVAHWARHGFGWWFLHERATGDFVGEVGLQRTEINDEPVVEVGWTLLSTHWGQGFATEAATAALTHGFGSLGLDEIVSFTMTQNTASRRVMARLDMTYDHDIDRAGLPHVLYRIRANRWSTKVNA